jgi:Tfp pilus assembly protein PilX
VNRSLRSQRGMTLVVALVMLVVLTLLVVSGIRFGNINLKIAGNAQVETEATAAAQVGLETAVRTMVATTDISTIAAQPSLSITTGGATYRVAVTKPGCIFTKNVPTSDLDATKPADQVCFEATDTDKLVTSSGTLTTTPSACKDQQWDVQAAVDDSSNSGAKVTVLQGASVRVGAQVDCP